jgi:hypothetical protein
MNKGDLEKPPAPIVRSAFDSNCDSQLNPGVAALPIARLQPQGQLNQFQNIEEDRQCLYNIIHMVLVEY